MSHLLLSPPWYTLVNQIKYTYGRSPYVKVNDLIDLSSGLVDSLTPSEFLLIINVSNNSVACALRQVLPAIVKFGGVKVFIVILDCKGIQVNIKDITYTSESLAKLFCEALKMNPLFSGVVVKPEDAPSTVGDVVVVIKKEIIQFFNDDITDLCSNYNEVAANTFAAITRPEYKPDLRVGFSTYDQKCLLQKNIICPGPVRRTRC